MVKEVSMKVMALVLLVDDCERGIFIGDEKSSKDRTWSAVPNALLEVIN